MQSKSYHSFTLFGHSRSFEDLKYEYNQRHSQLEQLINQLSQEEKNHSTSKLSTNVVYRFNSITNEWESITEHNKKERNKTEFEAAEELAALFSQQNDLEDDDSNNNVTKSLTLQTRTILVKHGLHTPNPKLKISNKELIEALRQLVPKLKMPDNITFKQAEVALEVMDVVINALNEHLGYDKANDSKNLIQRLSTLAKELENKSFIRTFAIILATLLFVTTLLTVGIAVACLNVPGFHLAAATILSLSTELFTTGFLPGTLLAISPFRSLLGLGILAGWGDYQSPNSNPELSSAILDVAKSLDLDHAQISTPAMTG